MMSYSAHVGSQEGAVSASPQTDPELTFDPEHPTAPISVGDGARPAPALVGQGDGLSSTVERQGTTQAREAGATMVIGMRRSSDGDDDDDDDDDEAGPHSFWGWRIP